MAPDPPHYEPGVIAAVERLVGARVVGQRDVAGGYTFAANRVAELSDGRTVFVKAAVDALTRDWLRAEQRLYASVQGASSRAAMAGRTGRSRCSFWRT